MLPQITAWNWHSNRISFFISILCDWIRADYALPATNHSFRFAWLKSLFDPCVCAFSCLSICRNLRPAAGHDRIQFIRFRWNRMWVLRHGETRDNAAVHGVACNEIRRESRLPLSMPSRNNNVLQLLSSNRKRHAARKRQLLSHHRIPRTACNAIRVFIPFIILIKKKTPKTKPAKYATQSG